MNCVFFLDDANNFNFPSKLYMCILILDDEMLILIMI